MYLQLPNIGSGEITIAVLIAFMTAFYLTFIKYTKRMEKSDEEWLQLMREYVGLRQQAVASSSDYYQEYQQQYQLQQQQTTPSQANQQPRPRYKLYDDDAAVDTAPKGGQTEAPPFPYAIDVFGRVLTCPRCRVERGESRPLMILHRDESGYTLTCGRTDAQGRLHLYKLQDTSASVAPLIEAKAIAEALTSPTATAKRRAKKREEEDVDVEKDEE